MAVVVESIDNHQDEPFIPDSEKQRLRGQLVPAHLSHKPDGQEPLRASSRDCLCYYRVRLAGAIERAREGMASQLWFVYCFST